MIIILRDWLLKDLNGCSKICRIFIRRTLPVQDSEIFELKIRKRNGRKKIVKVSKDLLIGSIKCSQQNPI